MNRILLGLIFYCVLFSCQKVIKWDLPSKGSLAKDNNGKCLPVAVNGNYVQDSTTDGNNFMVVDVNVVGIGTYHISTDSINGYVFRASGEFTNTGINHVKLLCMGKPASPDTNYFIIRYDTSFCEAVVVVKSNAIPSSVFTLSGAPGVCMNYTVSGKYTKNVRLDTTNLIDISVDVVEPGRYDIATDIVNGYTFAASGIFTNRGTQTIKLYARGIPENEGSNVFSVHASLSVCSFSIETGSDKAKFTLLGSPGKCLNDTVIGTYIKNIGLDTFSKVNVDVNVSLAGTYDLETDTVNGYSFHGFGVFTQTGIHTVTMHAVGIPLKEGKDIFTVTGGSTSCSFEVITLSDFVTATGNDYFPLTDSSNWVYDDLFFVGNSIKRVIAGDSSANGYKYSVMQQSDNFGLSSQYLFRKDGSTYFEYTTADKYTASFSFKNSIYTDLPFLNENVTEGDYWESDEYQGAATFNQELVLKYGYKCVKRNTVATVNGKAFANVKIIEMRPQIHSLGNPWSYTNEVYTYYYAKGIGLIYFYASSNFGFRKAQMQINTWLVK